MINNNVLIIAMSSIVLSACAPSIQLRQVENLPAGLDKTTSVDITSWFTVTGQLSVTEDSTGLPVTHVVPNSPGNPKRITLAGSNSLPQGRQVSLTWKLPYQPLLIPGSNVETQTQTFTVLPMARLDFIENRICLRKGELLPVAIRVSSTNTTAPLVNFTITPASLATPVPVSVPNLNSNGNSVNVQGVQIGEGDIEASAVSFVAASIPVRVIEPLEATILSTPVNGATQVYYTQEPRGNPATVSVHLEWHEVPSANEYRTFFASNNGDFTFTNSTAPFLDLSFPPGTVVRWKVAALFDSCSQGNVPGPESEERTFTVWRP